MIKGVGEVDGSRLSFPWLSTWLFGVALLVAVMVIVGGITRLTGSGLSIVVWDVVGGVVPPLSAADWEFAFAQYRQTPEFAQINSWMTVDDFKVIYWWEWIHRFLGRVVGVVYAVPLVIFALRRMIPAAWLGRFVFVFGLGALQGVVGWWMVRSGLVDQPEVSPYRLALHLGLAFIIFGFLLDYAIRWSRWGGESSVSGQVTLVLAQALPILIFVQIVAGAFVAGTDAGRVLTNWPLMGETFWPTGMLELQPTWRNFTENRTLVQFDHRILAYLILVLAVVFVFVSWRSSPTVRWWAVVLLVASLAQATLGVATLMTATATTLALTHQFGAVVVFAVAVATRRVVLDARVEPVRCSLRG